MANNMAQMAQKRSVKPKEQYSPSNPPATTKYHLIVYDDNGMMMIVGNSSIKRFGIDDSVIMNGGRAATLIISGTKDACIKQWNKQARLSTDKNEINRLLDDDDDVGIDDTSESLTQTITMPTNPFSTRMYFPIASYLYDGVLLNNIIAAPHRRQKPLVRRPSSSDLTSTVVSPKRFAPNNRSSHTTNQRGYDLSSKKPTRSFESTIPVISSSDDEASADHNASISIKHILEEIKNVQTNVRDVRSENHDTQQQLSSLTKKLSHFRSLILSNQEHVLDRYRDELVTEEFKTEIMYRGNNLLEVAASSAAEYARKLLKVLFSELELKTSLLPSQQSKRYFKPELDSEKFNLLNEATRHRYRISKHHYSSFYKERIQESLAGCLYNEGTRKQRRKAIQQQQQQQQIPTQQQQQPCLSQCVSDNEE
ncbi:unnamed protein product [Adineta ricciae]|uniref:BEN domain-containing protein n=1 Tax=Adineta ricciae TaxID=249248 RepID=A0A815UYX2_ADIRI|nr:unnamed protein product [Adineta ricciae]CAF1523662.1 unnamed protein product [Adineta ricciae]